MLTQDKIDQRRKDVLLVAAYLESLRQHNLLKLIYRTKVIDQEYEQITTNPYVTVQLHKT